MAGQSTDLEKVALALKTEQDGNGFYTQAKKQVSHKLARAAFELLAKEELRHVALIRALGDTLEGGGGIVEPNSPSRKSLEANLKTIYGEATEEGTGELDAGEAYERAMELERKISALYFEYSNDCDSDEAKRLFDALYREEQDHLSLIEDMHGYLTKPDQWFIDRDGVMLDGG